MEIKLLVFHVLITTVNGRNSPNGEFNEWPKEMLLEAACRSLHKVNSTCQEFSTSCGWNTTQLNFAVVNQTEPTRSLEVSCKDYDMLHLVWKNQGDDFIHFLQVRRADISESDFFSNVTDCTSYTLENLEEDISYNIRLWSISFSQKQIIKSVTITEKTSKKFAIPSPVTKIFIQNMTYKGKVCDVIIQWNPNEDHSCHYDLVWLKEGIVVEDRISVVSDSHQTLLKALSFETNYSIEIIAKGKNPILESPKKVFRFATPSCIEVYRHLNNCRPEIPKGFVVSEKLGEISEKNWTYDIELKWQKPVLVPDYYVAEFVNLIGGNSTHRILNIKGNESSASFDRVELGELYHVSLMACSSGGCSKKTADERHLSSLNSAEISSHQEWKVFVIILAPLSAVLLGILAANYYRNKQKRKEEREKYFNGLDEEKLPQSLGNLEINLIKDVSDQWELDHNKLRFQSIIGEGAFGIVRRGYLEASNNTKIEVAIKMLKESPSSEEIRQFVQEINIMKSVRRHTHIVSLIGCISEGRATGPLLVVEYCSRGDLLTYLRNAWDKFCTLQQEILNNEETRDASPNYFSNKTYDFHKISIEDEFKITPKHLLSIARQVALGMEHLAKTRVVHRDLAARNVLVCENHTVKVSDFGLSRDIYRDDVYCKKTGGKLPIRWMALESLTHQRYTTHSDVWSFGILMWEIVTLGGTPYVGVHSTDLLQFLVNGNRLDRPSHCSPELYAIMQSCWKVSPKQRPTFTELCKMLENLLENVSHYLQVDNTGSSANRDKNQSGPSLTSNDSYIRPIN